LLEASLLAHKRTPPVPGEQFRFGGGSEKKKGAIIPKGTGPLFPGEGKGRFLLLGRVTASILFQSGTKGGLSSGEGGGGKGKNTEGLGLEGNGSRWTCEKRKRAVRRGVS